MSILLAPTPTSAMTVVVHSTNLPLLSFPSITEPQRVCFLILHGEVNLWGTRMDCGSHESVLRSLAMGVWVCECVSLWYFIGHLSCYALKSIPVFTQRPWFPQVAPLTKCRRSTKAGLFLRDARLFWWVTLLLPKFLRTALRPKTLSLNLPSFSFSSTCNEAWWLL